MKKLLFALALVGIPAVAAMAAGSPIRATVPFDFAVVGTELTAGVYTIEENSAQGILMIRDAEGRIKAMFMVDRLYRTESTEQPAWVFNRYGDRYFLSHVWGAGQTGAGLRKSKIERELVASSATPPADQVLVVAAFYHR
jgi:hypothetical protein